MNSLDFLDLLQILGIISSFFIGFIPNVITLKENGRITKRGFLIIFLFFASLFLAVGTTIYKSIDDKEKYLTTINSAESTLSNVNENLALSNKLLEIGDSSIKTLEKVEDKSRLLWYTSDSIRKTTLLLNEKLAEEILLQRKITAESRKSLEILNFRNDYDYLKDSINLRTDFIAISSLRVNCKVSPLRDLILGEYQYFKAIEDSLFKNANKITIDSNKKVYLFKDVSLNDFGDLTVKVIDNKAKYTNLKYQLDSLDQEIKKCLLSYYYQALDIIRKDLSNSIVLTNREISKIWMDYYTKIEIEIIEINYGNYDFSQAHLNKIQAEHQDFGNLLREKYIQFLKANY